MNDFFSKLENFLFDILGLILPGAIFLLILLSPILVMDMGKAEKVTDPSAFLVGLTTMWHVLKNYWSTDQRSVLAIATVLAYLFGHTIKVFSRVKYNLLPAIFDKTLNKGVADVYRWFLSLFPVSWRTSKPWGHLRDLAMPFLRFIRDIFTFGTVLAVPRDIIFLQDSAATLNSKLSIDVPADQEVIAKLSSVVTNQESLRSLGTFYLAKYNLYRSLALIFLLTTFYYNCFFHLRDNSIIPTTQKISGIILAGSALLWFTFHSKFKRYWTQYGEERILTLFYFLNKKKLNESGHDSIY